MHLYPLFNTLPDFYSWLAANPDVIAQFNHPDPSYGGTFSNFADYPAAAQVMYLQEIGNKAQRYTTYEPSFVQSNAIGWVKAYIRSTTHLKKPFINRGDPITIIGIVSQYSEEEEPSRNDYRLLPRYQTDLIVPGVTPPPPANWSTLLPQTGY